MAADEEIRELYQALAERDRHIDELEDELTNLEEEGEKQRDDLHHSQDKIAELQVLVKELRQDNDGLLGDKSGLEDQLNAHKSQLDAQKSILAVATRSSEEAKRIQKDGNQQLHRLEVENQRLRATVLELEENEDILVNEIDTLVREKSECQEQSEELSAQCDTLYADLDEKTRVNSQLLQDKEKAQNDLAEQSEEYHRDIEKYRRKDTAGKAEIARLLTELEQERAKHKELAYIKENEAFRKELTKVRQEKEKLAILYDQCLLDRNNCERDLDSAIQALNQSKRNAKERIASALRKEKVTSTEANAKIERVTAKLDLATQRCLDGEEQIEDLRQQLERSEARNLSYENNHGLTEVIQRQKQLEADIRRRDYDLKRVTDRLGAEIGKCRVLKKACQWIQEKAGPDYEFNDAEIQEALESEDNRLQSDNRELVRQIELIEGERTKLLSQLRERSIEMGEKGIRFMGMSPDKVEQVVEFASNLRKGIVELPLNDRSKELLQEIASLKSDKEVDRITIERLEREIEAARVEGESHLLQQVMNKITADNQKLREENVALSPSTSLLTPLMQSRAKELLGDDLVKMPAAAEAQFICLMNEYEKATQELALLKVNTAKHGSDEDCRGAVAQIPGKQPEGCGTAKHSSAEDAMPLHLSQIVEQFKRYASVANSNNDQKVDIIAKNMVKAMKDLAHEHDMLLAQLHESRQAQPGKVLEDWQKKELPVSEADGVRGIAGVRDEMESMCNSLEQTQMKLSGYIGDVRILHDSVHAIQDLRFDSARVAIQISCLNDIITEKNRIIQETKQKLAEAKQMNLQLVRDRGFHEQKSDRSISTNSIDKYISRAANGTVSGHSTPTRNHIQQHLEEATKLIFEKESVISEQNQSIFELKQKLASADESYQLLLKDAESMKIDREAEAAVSGVNAYQQQNDEAQDMLNKNKMEMNTLKGRLRDKNKDHKDSIAKIKELQDSVTRAKRVLSVTRQGRARSEQNLKASNEEVNSLKEQLKKMGEQMNALKKEKIDAQNEKLKLSRKARLSQIKLKETSKNMEQLEKNKTVEELEKRVNVLNKTVSGLASQNSKLRGELAAYKLKSKAKEEDLAMQQTSRERPMSSRSKSLEVQVSSLQKMLSREKKHASDSSSLLDRYQKRIHSLEQALRNSATGKIDSGKYEDSTEEAANSTNLLKKQLLSLTDENKSLKQRIKDMDSDSNAEAQVKRLKAENDALKKENERLSQVDHLDFFEEIEDLKYKYNEAVRQINQLTIG